MQCGHNDGCRARRWRSRSSSKCHSRMPSQIGWTRYTCCSLPNTLPPRYHSAGELFSPSLNTMTKLSLAVSIPAYTRSSCSTLGVAQALLDDDEDWEEDFQIPHTPIHHVVRWEEGGQGKLATEQMEASRGSPAWWLVAWVDISEEEPETLKETDAHWRAQWWLQVATQGIRDKEVPWHDLLAPLRSGAEGVAKALAKCLVAVWRWNIKVRGEGVCPPAPLVLNISQFLTDQEVEGGMGELHWFVAYSHTLQRVGEAAHGRKWDTWWEALEIKASPLVCAFWHGTEVDLTMVSVKHCWQPTPRTLHHQRDNGPPTHIISYLDELAVCLPTSEAWDKMVWLTMAATPWVPTKAESYGYCWGQAVDLSPMMPAAQFWITNKRGTYLCTTRALVFKGSILAYNPPLNEAEWIPAWGLVNDLSWGEERSVVALANYVQHALKEGKRIARLRVSRVVSCPGDNSSTTSMEGGEESQFSDTPSMGLQMDMDREVGEESEEPVGSEGEVSRQTNPGEEAKASPHIDRCQCSQNWESVMEESAGSAFDDLCSGSDTTITGVDTLSAPPFSPRDESGDSPPTRSRGSAPHSLGSPMEAGGMPPLVPVVTIPASGADTVEVRVPQFELDNL